MLSYMRMLFGGRGATVQLRNGTMSKGVTSGSASVTASFNASGSASYTGLGSYAWLTGGAASAYEIRATLNSNVGLTSSGNGFGSWLPLSSSAAWSFTRSSHGEGTADVTIEIRPAGGGSVIASCELGFNCSVGIL